MVAYALYKRQKREWARTIHETTGNEPTLEQDEQFALSVSTPSALERFRQGANDMLVAFANQVVEDERPNIETEAVHKRVETAVISIKRANGFWRQILFNLLASAVTISVLVTLIIAAKIFGIDDIIKF
jgi:hypothetical protein